MQLCICRFLDSQIPLVQIFPRAKKIMIGLLVQTKTPSFLNYQNVFFSFGGELFRMSIIDEILLER